LPFLVLLFFLSAESSWEGKMEQTYLEVKRPTAEDVEAKELDLLLHPKKLPADLSS
jgi:hypothetical protein